MNRCTTCGRGEPCPPCFEGSPPPERLADIARERAQRIQDVRADLTAIPDAYAQLALFRVAGTRPPDPDRRSGNGVLSRPPLDLTVLDLEDEREKPDAEAQRTDYDLDRRAGARRQGVLPTLASWTRLVDGELWDEGQEHEPPADTPTVSSECSFLLTNLDWCAEQQWFNELAEDVRKIRADIRWAIGDRDPLPLQCLACGWQVESMADGAWFRCTGCPSNWSRLELHKLHERQKPKTLAEVAEITGRPISTLKDWARRRWIKPVARDHRGALYSLKKVQDFAVKVQQGRKFASVSK